MGTRVAEQVVHYAEKSSTVFVACLVHLNPKMQTHVLDMTKISVHLTIEPRLYRSSHQYTPTAHRIMVVSPRRPS